MAEFSIITRTWGCPTSRMLKEEVQAKKKGRKNSQTDGGEKTVVEVGCDMIFLGWFFWCVFVCGFVFFFFFFS